MPTTTEWIYLGLLFLLLFLIVGIAEKIRSALGWSPEVTRKFVHISTGIVIFFTPFIFRTNIPLIVLAGIFTLVNAWSLKAEKFKGMHETKRTSYGTIFYPVSVIIMALLFWNHYPAILQIGILILAFSDAFAAIVGENLKHPHKFNVTRDSKSVEGSLTFAVTTFLIVALGLTYLSRTPLPAGMIIWIAFLTAVITTFSETLSWAGSDNITAPLTGTFVLHLSLAHPGMLTQFSVGTGLAALVVLISYRANFLDIGGAMAVFLLGTLIFGVGGWIWAVPILIFFFSSSILSKLWPSRKAESNLLFEKSSRRDWAQVLANGGMAGISMILWYIRPTPIWYIIYLGSLAAVTADTWATEIGVLSKRLPRLITTFKKVIPGTSGGVSVIGLFGALLGSLFIAVPGIAIAPAFLENPLRAVILVTFAGLGASLVDSFFGATLQAQFRCLVCHKMTEKRFHCRDTKTLFEHGKKWINNDVVNSFCALSGFVFTGLFVFWLR
ncbi:cytidylyltransferase family protein [bacterium BMS3Abin05]|nr:cytidylyltransferase family protein [bacterium BMS3Abin05]GBE27230.1 cytidylyltransferase family protein [bacterium BMS3Bbin03]